MMQRRHPLRGKPEVVAPLYGEKIVSTVGTSALMTTAGVQADTRQL